MMALMTLERLEKMYPDLMKEHMFKVFKEAGAPDDEIERIVADIENKRAGVDDGGAAEPASEESEQKTEVEVEVSDEVKDENIASQVTDDLKQKTDKDKDDNQQ